MSSDAFEPAKDLREPPFYGPDGQYYPPSDIGEIPRDQLPGHMELPRVGRGYFVNWGALRQYGPDAGCTPMDAEQASVICRWRDQEQQIAEAEHRRAEAERLLAEQARLAAKERHRAEQLAAKLRELGIDPDQLGT